MENKVQILDHEGCCKARTVLWFLVFTGFSMNYMLRVNLNMAIVSMVTQKVLPASNSTVVVNECFAAANSSVLNSSLSGNDRKLNLNQTGDVRNYTLNHIVSFQLQKHQSSVTEKSETTTDYSNVTSSNYTVSLNNTTPALVNGGSPTFSWDEHQQGSILGAFFWLHWATQLPGGILANRYGTKAVFGFANFSGVLFCFVMPSAAKLGPGYLITARLLQGLFAGFAWPSMHHMAARWIPPNERSRFVTAYLGSSLGAAMTYTMCGLVIERWGWEMVFYVSGILGTIWFICWWSLIYDTPAQHPRISPNERAFIEASIGNEVTKTKVGPIPWRKLLTSGPMIVNGLAEWGGSYGFFTLMTYSPTYFKLIHGAKVRTAGFFSGLPHMVRILVALMCSFTGDYLLRTNRMSRTNVRKWASAIGLFGQGICMISLAYSGCNYTAAVIFLTMAVACHGTVSTGVLANLVDIAPNYASVSFGIISTLIAGIGFIMPAIVGAITFESQTIVQWQKVYWVATGQLFLAGIIFSIFATSEIQDWNFQDGRNSEARKELVTMNECGQKNKENKFYTQSKSLLLTCKT